MNLVREIVFVIIRCLTFGTMSSKQFIDEHRKLIIQRWFYALVGVLTMIPIVLFTFGQIRLMKKDQNEFTFYLLLLFHSGLFYSSYSH